MGMVARLFMVTGGVMLRRVAVVLRGLFVMFGSFQVMLFTFFRHGALFLRLRISVRGYARVVNQRSRVCDEGVNADSHSKAQRTPFNFLGELCAFG